MELTTLRITGMKCEDCAAKLTEALSATAGVEKVDVAFFSNRAAIGFDRAKTSVDALKDVVRAAGFDIKPMHGEEGVCCGSCGGQ